LTSGEDPTYEDSMYRKKDFMTCISVRVCMKGIPLMKERIWIIVLDETSDIYSSVSLNRVVTSSQKSEPPKSPDSS